MREEKRERGERGREEKKRWRDAERNGERESNRTLNPRTNQNTYLCEGEIFLSLIQFLSHPINKKDTRKTRDQARAQTARLASMDRKKDSPAQHVPDIAGENCVLSFVHPWTGISLHSFHLSPLFSLSRLKSGCFPLTFPLSCFLNSFCLLFFKHKILCLHIHSPGRYGYEGATSPNCAGPCDLGRYGEGGNTSPDCTAPCDAGYYGDTPGNTDSTCDGLCAIGR